MYMFPGMQFLLFHLYFHQKYSSSHLLNFIVKLNALMLACLHFSHTVAYYDGCYVATVRVLSKCFARINVVVCKHLFCSELWLTIFALLRCVVAPLIWTMCL